jgi:hypothetical protein
VRPVDAAAEAQRQALGAGARAGVGGERHARLGGGGAQVVGQRGETNSPRVGSARRPRARRPVGVRLGAGGRRAGLAAHAISRSMRVTRIPSPPTALSCAMVR